MPRERPSPFTMPATPVSLAASRSTPKAQFPFSYGLFGRFARYAEAYPVSHASWHFRVVGPDNPLGTNSRGPRALGWGRVNEPRTLSQLSPARLDYAGIEHPPVELGRLHRVGASEMDVVVGVFGHG